jgi:hypothetical protein
VLNVVTSEEARVREMLVELASGPGSQPDEGLYTWDIVDQFTCQKPARDPFDIKREATPATILKLINEWNGSGTFVLPDFHQVWKAQPSVLRGLRNMAARLPGQKPAKNIVIITPEPCLPIELKADIPLLELLKPDATEMRALVEPALRGVTANVRDRLVEASLGLTGAQALRVLKKASVGRSGPLDERAIDLVRREKQAIIRESGALELFDQQRSADEVGGLVTLKEWLRKRENAFGPEAREYGLDMPRGVALIGIPGTGKSLCAKVSASMWRMPLLRLDMGAVFGGLVGLSEKNIRDAIRIAEVIAPCVLWVDEIEKGFATSHGDSGTAARVLSTFLTWMQEKSAPVFVFATANAVTSLPPEFLRKGRFDEVFFLDLPTNVEREQILEVHLRRKNMTMIRRKFDLPRIAEATDGFVGAELEAVVNEAMFPAFMDGKRAIETEDLLRAAGDMVPLAKSRPDEIRVLRGLVESGQARRASANEQAEEVRVEKVRGSRLLDIR